MRHPTFHRALRPFCCFLVFGVRVCMFVGFAALVVRLLVSFVFVIPLFLPFFL